MKYILVMVVALSACGGDKLESSIQAECTALLEHVVAISPQGKGVDPAAVVAALPIEDFQGCAATEPEIRACIAKATDVAAIRKCPPSEDVTNCVHAASVAHDQNKLDDASYAARRARCWAGDTRSAERLKTN